MITACHSCDLNGKGDPRCITCKRVSQDDIRISKTPHAKAEMIAAQQQAEQTPPCTNLPEDIEDTLRKAMATFWALDPIQLLCVQHIMNGQRLATFGERLRTIHAKISHYRGSERAQAGMMRDAIAKRAPMLAPILNAHVKGVKGDALKRLDDMPTGDLFEWGGVDAPFDKPKHSVKK